MIDEAEMHHLMKLARLDLTPDEANRMRTDLNKILGYFEKLSELDTEGVEEMQRPVALENVLRDDVPTAMLSRDEALALAVETQDGLFKVPRTVDQ